MRMFKFIAGTALLLIGLYVLVGERMAGTSTDATLNARVIVMRSPIEGEVSLSVRSVGSRLGGQEPVAEIVDNRHDTSRLLDLERQLGLQTTEFERIKGQLAALAAARRLLQSQSDNYQTGRISQIEARLGEAQAALESAQARLREAESALKRTTDLSGRGLQTAITLDRARSNFDVAEQDVASANQRLTYLRTELEAARQGVFLGDSYNDTPFSLQRIREIDLRAAELEAERAQAEKRIALGQRQIDAERVRVNRLTSAALATQSSGIVWDILADSGEYVRRGQDLVRIVDCGSLRITASVSEGVYNTLNVGSEAQLRLYGDDRVFTATIVRLGGASAANLYVNMAVAPSAEHLRRFDVSLTAPELAKHADLECAIGRTGRLVFTTGPLATFKQALTRFGL